MKLLLQRFLYSLGLTPFPNEEPRLEDVCGLITEQPQSSLGNNVIFTADSGSIGPFRFICVESTDNPDTPDTFTWDSEEWKRWLSQSK